MSDSSVDRRPSTVESRLSSSPNPVVTKPAQGGFSPRLRGIRVLLVIATLYSLVLIYPPLRLLHWWFPELALSGLTVLALSILPMALRLSYEWYASEFTRWLSAIALTHLGICFVSLNLVLLGELLLLFGVPLSLWVLISGITLPALIAYGLVNAQWLRVTQLRLPGKGKARGRLIQISDVHLGSRSPRLLKRIVDRVRTMGGDMLLITGDFIDFRNMDAEILKPLQQLKLPIVFIIGNHERYVDCEAICERLRDAGVIVLRNNSIALGDFHLIGIDDAERRDQVELELAKLPRDDSRYQILLYHRPDGFEAAQQAKIDLMLCGHTHGGQIIPFNWLVKRVFPRLVGLHVLGASHLYVSSGTGTWGPVLRLGTRSEITVFDLD